MKIWAGLKSHAEFKLIVPTRFIYLLVKSLKLLHSTNLFKAATECLIRHGLQREWGKREMKKEIHIKSKFY